MRLAVFALARPTFDTELAAATAATALESLALADLEMVGDATLLMDDAGLDQRLHELSAFPVDGVLVLQASFCDASMVKSIALSFDAPLAIWAFPEPRTGGRLRLNAFCGLNLAAHALGRLGRPCPYIYAAPETLPDPARLFRPPDRAPLIPAADPSPNEAARALAAMEGPYGLVGQHPTGFDTCTFDAETLRTRFGVTVEPVALDQVFAAARAQPEARVSELLAETRADLAGIDRLEAEPIDKALRAYAALADLAASRGLKGLAVRCWPETFTEYGCAVCGAMARLNDELVPASCEADMLGTLGSRLLQDLAGAPAMLADIVDMDDASDTTVLWHCGLAPLAMRDPESVAEATVHTNRLKPLLNQFALRPGRVTLARLSQARGELKLALGRGRMIRAPRPYAGTAGTLVLDGGTARCRDLLIGTGLEHHVSLVYGDVKAALFSVAHQVGIPVVDLDLPS